MIKKNIINNSYINLCSVLKNSITQCKEFKFIVSFIRMSGVQILLDVLKEAEEKGIQGRIITSNYMGISEKKAIEYLLKFKNIELKFYNAEKKGFHAKGYIFNYSDYSRIIIGSSNMTSGGLYSNIEWNSDIVIENSDSYYLDILDEFNFMWDNSIEYDEKYFFETSINQKNKLSYRDSDNIVPNYMQEIALENLKRIRLVGGTRAMGIAATGTGKTYLAAFDIKNFNPNRILYVAHREEILDSSKNSFKKIMSEKLMGKYTGKFDEIESKFLFSTVQKLHRNLKKFNKKEFDYIVIDEAHHVASETYQKIINYFEPKFLLGLTATPERTDGINIYEIFHGNIAMEIRLREALNERLISPFHYYGITDIIEADLSNVNLNDLNQVAKKLMIHKRTDYILEKINFYSYSGQKMIALGFCVNINHAEFMAQEFNKRGVKSAVLTGKNNLSERKKKIKELEDEGSDLRIIFTVDIFNEGIDIPNINTVIMLRPTDSSIIFIQQLGRGLRKSPNKEFVTVLDFIGNHKKIFLTAMAFNDEKTYDKDTLKGIIKNDFKSFSEYTHISMDKISRERILEQIENENFNTLKYIKEEYNDFKVMLGRIPKYLDYINYQGAPDIYKFILKFKSYYGFLSAIKENKNKFNSEEIKVLEEVESFLPIKRIHEYIIVKYLINEKNIITLEDARNEILKFIENTNEKTILHSFKNLGWYYLDDGEKRRKTKLFNFENNKISCSQIFEKALNNIKLKAYLQDVLTYGILEYNEKFSNTNYGIPFLKLYEKYSMRDVALLSNYEKLHSSYRNGINPSEDKKNYYMFINLDKDKNSNFDNVIYDRRHFKWYSKKSTKIDSEIGKDFIYSKERRIKLHFFIRKFSKIDNITQPFVYLGTGYAIEYSGNNPIEFKIRLDKKIDKIIYLDFITY